MDNSKYTKIAKQLKGVIIALIILAFLLFIGILPLVGKALAHTFVEYESYLNITMFWTLLASIPIFYSIVLLNKVVKAISQAEIFIESNYKHLKQVAQLIKIDVLLSIIFYVGLLFFIPHSFVLTFIAACLAIIGYLSAQFFDFLAFSIGEGITYYEDIKLTI